MANQSLRELLEEDALFYKLSLIQWATLSLTGILLGLVWLSTPTIPIIVLGIGVLASTVALTSVVVACSKMIPVNVKSSRELYRKQLQEAIDYLTYIRDFSCDLSSEPAERFLGYLDMNLGLIPLHNKLHPILSILSNETKAPETKITAIIDYLKEEEKAGYFSPLGVALLNVHRSYEKDSNSLARKATSVNESIAPIDSTSLHATGADVIGTQPRPVQNSAEKSTLEHRF